jgi:hypothetical protein
MKLVDGRELLYKHGLRTLHSRKSHPNYMKERDAQRITVRYGMRCVLEVSGNQY